MKLCKRIYIYRNVSETLPDNGWFQQCVLCKTVTSGLHYLKTLEKCRIIYEYIAYLCYDCQKEIIKDASKNETLKKACDIYIKNNIIYPLNQIHPRHGTLHQVYLQSQRLLAQDLEHTFETVVTPFPLDSHLNPYYPPPPSNYPCTQNQ